MYLIALVTLFLSSSIQASEINIKNLWLHEDSTIESFSGIRFEPEVPSYFCNGSTKAFKVQSTPANLWKAQVTFNSTKTEFACTNFAKKGSLVIERKVYVEGASDLVIVGIAFDSAAPKEIVKKNVEIFCTTSSSPYYKYVFVCPKLVMHPEGKLIIDGLRVDWTTPENN